jgi:hypothetical protein
MSGAEIAVLMLGSSVVGSFLTALVQYFSKGRDVLQMSEMEFRKALMARVQQLEAHDERKSIRIRELENENHSLREKVEHLERRLADHA